MPMIHIHMISGRSEIQMNGLVRDITEAFIRNCGGDQSEVNIVIDEIDPRHWATGGVFAGVAGNKDITTK